MMTEYYDKLYDKHVKNSTGSGSGTGVRNGEFIDVVVDESCTEFDPVDTARMCLDALAAFESRTAAAKDVGTSSPFLS